MPPPPPSLFPWQHLQLDVKQKYAGQSCKQTRTAHSAQYTVDCMCVSLFKEIIVIKSNEQLIKGS